MPIILIMVCYVISLNKLWKHRQLENADMYSNNYNNNHYETVMYGNIDNWKFPEIKCSVLASSDTILVKIRDRAPTILLIFVL